MGNQMNLKNLCALVIALTVPLSLHAQTTLTNGLIAFYPFNGNANNAIGTNNGTVVGAVLAQDRFGVANAAYSFNGINQKIDFAAPPLTNIANWTVSAWIKPADFTQEGIAVQLGFDNASLGNGYGFGFNRSATFTGIFSGVGSGFISSGRAFSSTNFWYHVVMLRDSTTTRFYINGVQTPTTYSTVPKTPTDFTIGAQNISNVRFFNGLIDDVKIYNRALFFNEIAELYDDETTPPSDFATKGLIAFYPFSGNADDAVGGNHGTVQGAVLTTNRFGDSNSAYSFNGIDAYIDCGNKPEFNTGTNDFTISAWIRTQGSQVNKYIVGKYSANISGSYGLGTSGSSISYAFIWPLNQSSPNVTSGNASLSNGSWHQLTAVYQRNSALSIYRDGILESQTTISQTNVITNSFPLLIGKVSSSPTFGGLIDDVRFYQRALSSYEVSNLYIADITIPLAGIITLPTITIHGNMGMSCKIEYKNNVNDTIWTPLVTNFVLTNNFVLYPDITATNQPKRFYRVLNN